MIDETEKQRLRDFYSEEGKNLKSLLLEYGQGENDDFFYNILICASLIKQSHKPKTMQEQFSEALEAELKTLQKLKECKVLVDEIFGGNGREKYVLGTILAWRGITGDHIDAVFSGIRQMADRERADLENLLPKRGKGGNTETGKNHFIRLLGQNIEFLDRREQKAKFIQKVLSIFSHEDTLNNIKQKLRNVDQERS